VAGSANKARARRSAGPWQRPTSEGILSAAEAVFARRGYARTSLRVLIAEAGVSTTAFYARFASKEAVLEALIAELLAELHQTATRELGKARSLEEGFGRGVDAMVEVLSPRRALARLALTEAASSRVARTTMHGAYRMLARLLASELESLEERGRITGLDADAFGWALVGALQIQVVRWAVYEELDDEGLARSLRATARALLPAVSR
jgi:AcrR family transcriptional regulator